MGLATYTYNRSTSGGEIIRELVNASDGQGLHFDGAAGCIDIDSPPDLGTKFSFEFIVQQDENADNYLVDFDGALTSRFIIGRVSGNLSVYSSTTSFWVSFGVAPLDDNEVHHLVVTVDGTSAIAYDNGNQIASKTISSAHLIDSATDAKIGASYDASSDFFNGTIYRARFWNKALTAAEVTASYQNATVSFADQYGVEPAQNVSTCVQDASDPYTSFTSVSATGFTAIQTGAVASIAGTADEIALVLGKNYRVSFYIANTSQAPRVSFAESLTGSVLQELVGLGVMTTGTQTFDVTYTGATATGVLKFDNTAAASYAMTLLSITRVGCVADYDLAFANPEISFMVQDRAGAADGEASNDGTNPTGISQVTPIVQVNATAARIGTSAATVADGELSVSGNVGVGIGAPASQYGNTVHVNNPAGLGASLHLTDTTTGAGGTDGFELMSYGLDAYVFNREAGNLNLGTSNNIRLAIDAAGLATFSGGINVSAGNVTLPAQPAFSVMKSADQSDIAVGEWVDITWDTELFDQGANFASNTFTAPVTGKYQLNAMVRFDAMDDAANYYQVKFATSNRAYIFIIDPDHGQDINYYTFAFSALADMDASDTVDMKVYQSAGAAQTDIDVESWWNGFLAC